MATILSVEGVFVSFGGVMAVANVSCDVGRQSVTSIIGPNGAGKTTLINVISGAITPTDGKVIFEGQDITALPPHRVAELGIARTYQNLRLFKHMSTLENVMVARHIKTKSGFFSCALKLPLSRRDERAIRENAWECLEFVGLTQWADMDAL